MKKLLLILLCLPMVGFGQSWEKTFGGISLDALFFYIYDDGTVEKRIILE